MQTKMEAVFVFTVEVKLRDYVVEKICEIYDKCGFMSAFRYIRMKLGECVSVAECTRILKEIVNSRETN